jgi:hypothetical protein
MHEPAFANRPPLVEGLFQGIENEVGFGRTRDLPADDVIEIEELDQFIELANDLAKDAKAQSAPMAAE